MHDAIIETEGLVKAFGGRVRALDGLTLTVQQGSIFGLLGPNGAGKTTLIRILTTLLPPDTGTARVGGVDVRADPAGVRAQIGLAGQSAAVDDYLTGRENVEMVGRLYRLSRGQAQRGAREMLERIGLATVADRQVKTYSGGMRRRLDLAASLVGHPQVLFLDEPTAGLDSASRHDLWALIRDLADAGTTRTMVLLLAVGLAIGFRWQTSPIGLLAGVAIALGFGYAWSWAMAALGLVVRTPEAVQAAAFMGAFPLAFTSSVFVPTQTMPGWLQAFAANQPVTVTTNALRGLFLGQGALPPGQTVTGQVLLALVWSAAITAVFAPLAVRLYRHTVS